MLINVRVFNCIQRNVTNFFLKLNFEKSNISDLADKLQMLCDKQDIRDDYKKNAEEFILGKYVFDFVYEHKIIEFNGDYWHANPKIYDKVWLASRKIDGLRALIYMGDDGELHTASRGAMNYDAAMSEILSHPDLIKVFKEKSFV